MGYASVLSADPHASDAVQFRANSHPEYFLAVLILHGYLIRIMAVSVKEAINP